MGQLGAPRASQEQLWSGLGRSWGGLGPSWGGLGVIFGWSWGGLGRSERSRFGQKIVSKTVQRPRWPLDAILDRFLLVRGSIWGGSGVDLGRIWGRLGWICWMFCDLFGGRAVIRRDVIQASQKFFSQKEMHSEEMLI